MKCSNAFVQNVNVDLISELPDVLLICILSFLSTKEVVQTCMLSKRWRRIWADLTILKFNINEFGVDDCITCGTDEALRNFIARFEQFVNGVVKNREPTHLNRVYYVHDTERTDFYTAPMQWLDSVALLMPQLIDISIGRVKSLELPDSVFSCATLQHLKIEIWAVEKIIVIPASIYLPSLKVFDIIGVELHDNFAQKLLIGCPSLETLNLSFCNLYITSISSNMLKKLAIIESHQYEPMQISCPSLLNLYIDSSHRSAGISLKNMKSLRTVAIDLSSMGQYFGGGDVSVCNFLSGISNATQLMIISRLHIYSPHLKAQLEKDILNGRSFNNIKALMIMMCDVNFDFNLIPSLLKLFPNIKGLGLLLDMSEVGIQEEHMQNILGDVLFQHKYIETVRIRDRHMRKLPHILIKTLMKALNTYIKEIGNVIIE